MEKIIIQTDEAPKAIGPYSQAVLKNGVLYGSGQIAIDPKTGQLKDANISEETEQVMQNIKAVLAAAEMDFSHILKVTIFMQSMDDYAAINDVYAKYFSENPPAREAVEVSKLPKGVGVEMSFIAAK